MPSHDPELEVCSNNSGTGSDLSLAEPIDFFQVPQQIFAKFPSDP